MQENDILGECVEIIAVVLIIKAPQKRHAATTQINRSITIKIKAVRDSESAQLLLKVAPVNVATPLPM